MNREKIIRLVKHLLVLSDPDRGGTDGECTVAAIRLAEIIVRNKLCLSFEDGQPADGRTARERPRHEYQDVPPWQRDNPFERGNPFEEYFRQAREREKEWAQRRADADKAKEARRAEANRLREERIKAEEAEYQPKKRAGPDWEKVLFITITAKFDSRCIHCGQWIEFGHRCAWRKGVGVACLGCAAQVNWMGEGAGGEEAKREDLEPPVDEVVAEAMGK